MGFFKFRVDQLLDVPLGTVIENQAAIYFDYNAPVLTNTTWHTIGENYLLLEDPNDDAPNFNSSSWISPNPTSGLTKFWLQETEVENGNLHLYSAQGTKIIDQFFSGNSIELDLSDLPPGVYFYRIYNERLGDSTGKLIVQ